MKVIGLLGGMSWESTVTYYQLINQTIRTRLGGLHSAKIVLHSVDFHEIEQYQRQGEWQRAGELLTFAGLGLERSGANLLVLCTNTMHKVAPQIERGCSIPLLHIADATAREVNRVGLSTVALLGTRFTMEEDFYASRFRDRHGLRTLVPDEQAREHVHRIIYDELCVGRVEESSRRALQAIIQNLAFQGAQGIILGCTEISLLIGQEHSHIPLFDTTALHARAAVDAALGDSLEPNRTPA
jgi:aspartate racemase